MDFDDWDDYLALLILAWTTLLYAFAAIALTIAITRYAPSRAFSAEPASATPEDELPGVSILRPLHGLDCNLYANLESSFLQAYPKYEIIFSVPDSADPAAEIVRDLIAKYPNIPASLIVGTETVGVNPKINNLIRPYRSAAYDILWVIDSNVATSPQTLRHSVDIFLTRPNIGLVHHLPFAVFPDAHLGSRVEQVFLSSTHAKMYLAINWVAVESCVTGKSCLYKRSDIERISELRGHLGGNRAISLGSGNPGNSNSANTRADGYRDADLEAASEATPSTPTPPLNGLATFAQYLGEDNMIGHALWHELNLRHAMTSDLAGNAVGSMTFSAYIARRVRWVRVRKYMVLASTLIEPLTECLLSGVLLAWAADEAFDLSKILVFIVHVAAWFSADYVLFRKLARAAPNVQQARAPRHDGPLIAYLQAWIVRECLALPIWLFAMSGNTVGWRDNGLVYRVKRDGTVGLAEPGDVGWSDHLYARVARFVAGRRGGYVVYSPDEEAQ